MGTKRAGILVFGAVITLALALTACGGVQFEEYPSLSVTDKAGARSTADTARAPASPTPEFFTDPGKAGIAWMDHLKTCTPYSQTYQSPYLKVPQINTISGKDGDYCLMTMETSEYAILTCRLDAGGIKAMTSEELYAAMTDVYGAKPDAASDDVMKTQCELKMLGPAEMIVYTPSS